MKKLLFLLLVIQSLSTFSQVQSMQATFISTQKIEADTFVGLDALGDRCYIINNIFFKKNSSGIFQYKNPFLGKITRVDLQNPLKIMLLYADFNTVVLLDSQLNETEKIDFSKNETPIVATAAGMASQNKLWIYNSLTQQIGLYDYLNDTFKELTQSFQGGFKYYETDFNNFQWIDEQSRWRSCNIFGKITDIDIVPAFDQIKLVDNQIILFSKDGKLYWKDIRNGNVFLIENIEKSFKSFTYREQILSIFTGSQITNYKITTP
jgi:hypothetical protein